MFDKFIYEAGFVEQMLALRGPFGCDPRWVCWISKSDISRTTKCDPNNNNMYYKLGHTKSCSLERAFVQQNHLKFLSIIAISLSHFILLSKSDLYVWQTCLRMWFVEHLSQTLAVQQSVTKFIVMIAINLVTPKAATKHELLLNKPMSETLFVEQNREWFHSCYCNKG